VIALQEKADFVYRNFVIGVIPGFGYLASNFREFVGIDIYMYIHTYICLCACIYNDFRDVGASIVILKVL
jgi:hypothetical protein